MNKFSFKYSNVGMGTKARIGVITTPHGTIKTPAFVPVGTQATVKSLTPDEIKKTGTELFFVNTYHTYLRPGLDVIKKFGGLHKFMGWDGPIITDSGGFQVFSLARNASLVKISEEGVEFQSHWDGSKHFFTPELSMEYQWTLGSDIHIAFDDCTAYPVTYDVAKKSMEHTKRWAARSLSASDTLKVKSQKLHMPYQALYGVVQGSVYEDLRTESATYISSMDFEGIAIGGVSVGESKIEMTNVLKWVIPELPDDKPRHLLGVGEIDDVFTLIEHGIDTFDCVQPTRLARMGRVFLFSDMSHRTHESYKTNTHEIDITKSVYASDSKPIDATCTCYTCTHFSRAYLYHLFHVKELLGYRLATIHNVQFMHSLVLRIRRSLLEGTFYELKKRWVYDTV